MDSNNDLSHQPHPIQQLPPRSIKPLIWKVILILLLTVNLIFISLVGIEAPGAGMGLMAIYPNALILAIIDFIIVISYAINQQPRGIARVMWDVVLIALGFVIIVLGIFISIILHSMLHR